MFDIRDFVSLACLTNTPFPNNFAVAGTGIDKAETSPEDFVDNLFEDKPNIAVLGDRMRLFVAWGLGDLDKDLGLHIQTAMWNYFEPPVDSGQVEDLRQRIYGHGKHCGRDYTGYQPCAPKKYEPVKTFAEFKLLSQSYGVLKPDNQVWQNHFASARIRLADEWAKGNKDAFRRKRWPYLVAAFAQNFNVTARFMAAGLKGEF